VNTQDSQYGSSYAAWIVHFREHIAMQVSKSNKLANVCYDIRGTPSAWKRKVIASSS
jgi:alanine-synthesizing transaminase